MAKPREFTRYIDAQLIGEDGEVIVENTRGLLLAGDTPPDEHDQNEPGLAIRGINFLSIGDVDRLSELEKAQALLDVIETRLSPNSPFWGRFIGKDTMELMIQDDEDEGNRLREYGESQRRARERAYQHALRINPNEMGMKFVDAFMRFFGPSSGTRLRPEKAEIMNFIYFLYGNDYFVFEWITDQLASHKFKIRKSRPWEE